MEYGESPTITEEGCRASLTNAGQGEREVLGDVEGVDGPAKVQQPTLQCQQKPQVHVQPAGASLPAAMGGRGLAQSPVSTAMSAPPYLQNCPFLPSLLPLPLPPWLCTLPSSLLPPPHFLHGCLWSPRQLATRLTSVVLRTKVKFTYHF